MGTDRILIVGGGVAGLATAWSLARRGAKDVLLVERESSLCAHSSRKNAAILRTASADPVVEELSRRGAGFLGDPPQGFSDRPLLDPCGILIATGPREGELSSWERRALENGAAEEIPASRLSSIAPHLLAEGRRLLWFRKEGRIDKDALLTGFERGARSAGVRFDLGAGVRELMLRAGAVAGARLADGREIHAEQTVIATGGWARRLVASTGSHVRLRPTIRHLVVTEPDDRVDPRWPVVWIEEDPFYARPEAGGLMLCACDEVDADPDALAAVEEVRDLALAKAARWLPGLTALRVARFWSGVRTLTEDGRFVIGPDADIHGLFWVAGLGGHGMGCAAAVGELAAARLLGGAGADPAAAACDPARFALLTAPSS